MKDKTELKGIGGWLILVAIGVTLSPFMVAIMDYAAFSEVFSTDVWNALTNSNSPAYTPYFALVISVEFVVTMIIDAYLFYLIYLFYKKKSDFPPLYIRLVFTIFAFNIVDIFVTSLMFPDLTAKDLFDPLTIKAIFRSIVAILIWVPYMKKSVRVKNTFVS